MSELGESACGGGGGDDWCAVDGRRTDGRSVGRSVGRSAVGAVSVLEGRKGEKEEEKNAEEEVQNSQCAVPAEREEYITAPGCWLCAGGSKLEARLVARLVLGGSEGGDRSNDVADVHSSVGISRAPPRGAVSASRGISFSFSLSSFVYILSVSLPFSLSLLFSRSPIAGGARR